MSLRTFNEMHIDCGSCVYWGERGHWYVTKGRHRESDALEESNFRVLLKRLGGEGEHVAIEREAHWAVGWVEHLLIHPSHKPGLRVALQAKKDLEQYPVLDDEDFSNLEGERFYTWAKNELDQFADWENTLYSVEHDSEFSSSGPGDDSWESRVIEATKDRLETIESHYGTCELIDPRQMRLF